MRESFLAVMGVLRKIPCFVTRKVGCVTDSLDRRSPGPHRSANRVCRSTDGSWVEEPQEGKRRQRRPDL